MSQLKAAVFCNRTRITSVTLDLLTREIESHGLGVHYCVVGSPCQVEDATVIITFGGDGTVLKAVQRLSEIFNDEFQGRKWDFSLLSKSACFTQFWTSFSRTLYNQVREL